MAMAAILEVRTSARLTTIRPTCSTVGRDVLAFATAEERLFFPLLPLLDPAARAELGGEHEQLAGDLQLLELS